MSESEKAAGTGDSSKSKREKWRIKIPRILMSRPVVIAGLVGVAGATIVAAKRWGRALGGRSGED